MSQDHVADAAGTADERAWDAELLEMADDELVAALEALLLVVDTPAPTEQLAAAIGVTTERAETALRGLAHSLTAGASTHAATSHRT